MANVSSTTRVDLVFPYCHLEIPCLRDANIVRISFALRSWLTLSFYPLSGCVELMSIAWPSVPLAADMSCTVRSQKRVTDAPQLLRVVCSSDSMGHWPELSRVRVASDLATTNDDGDKEGVVIEDASSNCGDAPDD